MSQVQQIVRRLLAGHPGAVPDLRLSSPDALQLERAAKADAFDYWYSGLVSLGEAVQGIQRRSFSWPTVQAYYACFYLSRAYIAFGGTAIEFSEHRRKKEHFAWRSVAGSSPSKAPGNTHDAVLNYIHSQGLIPALRGQQIGTETVPQWLIAQRTQANYRETRFPDPNPSECTRYIAGNRLRRTLTGYIDDSAFLYAFDPDHAILAYPIALARVLVAIEQVRLSAEERLHLNTLFRDDAGDLSFLHPLYR